MALIASFAVYLVPLIGPHAVWLLGEHLYTALSRSPEHESALWLTAEVAVALGAQAALAVLLHWVLARRRLGRFVVLGASVPIFFVVLEWTYLIALPSYFLIERDVAPERYDWATECFLSDASLATVRTPAGLPLERAGRAWLSVAGGRSFALLHACEPPSPLDLGARRGLFTAPFVLADGKALFAVWDAAAGRNTWWYLPGIGAAAAPLERPPADPNRCAPILSDDGEWVAWIEFVPGATVTPLPQRVVIRALGGAAERVVPLPPPGPSSYELLGLDARTESVSLFEYDYATRRRELVTLDFAGARRGTPLVAEGVEPQSATFLRVADGWVAWDASREEGRYRLAWSLPQGRGSSQVLLGRGITAVDVDPSGSYVAVSTTTALNIGHIRDSVYVLRTRDGVEAFRRYLPEYTRSRVAFLGSSRFAYDEWNGERFGVRVVTVPPAG